MLSAVKTNKYESNCKVQNLLLQFRKSSTYSKRRTLLRQLSQMILTYIFYICCVIMLFWRCCVRIVNFPGAVSCFSMPGYCVSRKTRRTWSGEVTYLSRLEMPTSARLSKLTESIGASTVPTCAWILLNFTSSSSTLTKDTVAE